MEFQTNNIEFAFTNTGRDPKNVPIVSHLPERDQDHTVKSYQLEVVTESINKEDNDGKHWEPNWNDSSEEKWGVWPDIVASEEEPAGSGFTFTFYDFSYSFACCGSRLLYKTKAGLKKSWETFPELWKAELLIQKPQK